MDKKYILQVAESKEKYHKAKAKIPYEEKFDIIIALQKIDAELYKHRSGKSNRSFDKKVWQFEED